MHHDSVSYFKPQGDRAFELAASVGKYFLHYNGGVVTQYDDVAYLTFPYYDGTPPLAVALPFCLIALQCFLGYLV